MPLVRPPLVCNPGLLVADGLKLVACTAGIA